MKSFIRLNDFKKSELLEIFRIADSIDQYDGFLKGKTIVMFFPASSIRTRVSFEKGIYLLAGQSILFDPATLDKKEDIRDVCGYLQNWADAVIVRYPDINMIYKMAEAMTIPVINALTDDNHPCEMMSDLYALSKIRADYLNDKYLFVGADGNGAVLNPCPPFYRGEEVTDDVIDSDYFVGYEFKSNLLKVQQAILIYCLSS